MAVGVGLMRAMCCAVLLLGVGFGLGQASSLAFIRCVWGAEGLTPLTSPDALPAVCCRLKSCSSRSSS